MSVKYRESFTESVLRYNEKCSLLSEFFYPVLYAISVGFTLGALKELNKIKIPDIAIAGASIGVFICLCLSGALLMKSVSLSTSYGQEKKYFLAGANPASLVSLPAAYVIGASVDGMLEIKEYVSSGSK